MKCSHVDRFALHDELFTKIRDYNIRKIQENNRKRTMDDDVLIGSFHGDFVGTEVRHIDHNLMKQIKSKINVKILLQQILLTLTKQNITVPETICRLPSRWR